MKRYIKSTSFMDVLNDPEGRKIVDYIEDAESEMRGRGIDFDDESSAYARQRKRGIEELKSKFGYVWK